MQRIKNCIPTRDTTHDWGFAAAVQAGVADDEDPPDEVDHLEQDRETDDGKAMMAVLKVMPTS